MEVDLSSGTWDLSAVSQSVSMSNSNFSAIITKHDNRSKKGEKLVKDISGMDDWSL